MQQLLDPSRLRESFVFWENDLMAVLPDTANGRKIIRAFHSPLYPTMLNSNNFDNDVLDYATLQPLEKHLPSGAVFYNYDRPGVVRAMCVSAKDTVYREIAVTGPVYNLQGPAAGLITSALPLKVGLKVEFMALFSPFPYSQEYGLMLQEYTVTVVAEERISFHGQDVDTFVVVIESKAADRGLWFKQWITLQSPHTMLQFIYGSKREPDYQSAKPYVVRRHLPVR